jgi:hypothetical protein
MNNVFKGGNCYFFFLFAWLGQAPSYLKSICKGAVMQEQAA